VYDGIVIVHVMVRKGGDTIVFHIAVATATGMTAGMITGLTAGMTITTETFG